jgi:hypothetical protein
LSSGKSKKIVATVAIIKNNNNKWADERPRGRWRTTT